jgi:hypothetical protein
MGWGDGTFVTEVLFHFGTGEKGLWSEFLLPTFYHWEFGQVSYCF